MKYILFGFYCFLLFANPANAQDIRSIGVDKVLTFWDKYLSLPHYDRDGFLLKYKIRAEKGASLPKIELVNGNNRAPLKIDADGNIGNMPNLSNFKTTKVDIYGKTKVLVTLDAVPILPLGKRINVSAIQNSLMDYKAGIKIGGPAAALIAPKLNSVVFMGANSGEIVFSDGKKMALPKHANGLIFTNSKNNAKASYIEFNIPPKDVAFEK